MLKKIAVGALLTGLVAVLIWGAVIRTNAVSGQGLSNGGHHGQTTEFAASGALARGNGGRWSQEQAATDSNGGGRWGQSGAVEPGLSGQGNRALGGTSQADVRPQEWVTLQGVVVNVEGDLIEIKTATGEVIPFEGQPLRFALQSGFTAKVGDAVTVRGYEENGEFKIGQVINSNTGMSITLRDTTGRPGWAGRGRRG